MPQISIIIPTYNRAYLLAETISSVLYQTFKDFELIVVDDGSTDNTDEVVRSITDSRLRYIKQSNQGAPVARNTGIKAAKGEFVAFLDSDDLFLPDRLALQINKINEDPSIGFVYGRYFSLTFPDRKKVIAGACYSPLRLSNLLLDVKVHLSTVLVGRTWLEKVNGFDEQCKVSQEWDLYLRLSLVGCPMIGISEPLVVIRQEPGSLGKQSHKYAEIYFGILDRVFSDPRVPADVKALRNRIYGLRLVVLAASAYLASDPGLGRNFLERAVITDPSLMCQNSQLAANKIVNHLVGLSLDDPAKILQLVTANLPEKIASSKRFGQQLWGSFYIQQAFKAYQLGQRWRCLDSALRAITCTPAYLRNRGLISIMAQSLVGYRFDSKRRWDGLDTG